MMSPMSSSGRPTACSTMIVVIEPADGIPAAPIAIAVAVRLDQKKKLYNVHVHVVCNVAFTQLQLLHVSSKVQQHACGTRVARV